MLKYIDEKEFDDEVIKSDKVKIVDFYATWCPPCKMLSEVLENISKSRVDYDILKVDIDKNIGLAEKYKINVVPTMIFFKDGVEVERVEGFITEEEIIEKVSNYID